MTLQDISAHSRLDVAMRAYTTATARLFALQDEAAAAFRDYYAARQRLVEEHGVVCDIELEPGIDAAYSVYKQDIARTEAREIARADAQ